MLVADALDTDYPLDGLGWRDFVDRLLSDGAVDAYCPECSHATTFQLHAPYLTDEQQVERAKLPIVVVRAQCTRYPDTGEYRMQCQGHLTVCFLHAGASVKKIGMHPSKATLDFGTLDPLFTSRLSKQHRTEIGRAVGLRAHGVGVGSFVYLRRVFESLIEDAHATAQATPGWDEANYGRQRVAERITLLKLHLPSRLVENVQLYSILSLGIHELDEAQCLACFDLVMKGIELILRQRQEEADLKRLQTDLKTHSNTGKAQDRRDSGKN